MLEAEKELQNEARKCKGLDTVIGQLTINMRRTEISLTSISKLPDSTKLYKQVILKRLEGCLNKIGSYYHQRRK